MSRATILLPGNRHLSLQMAWAIRALAEKGASVFWECGLAFSDQGCIDRQRRVLAQVFGLRLRQPFAASGSQPRYVVFDETRSLIRPFGLASPVSCDRCEPIAHFGDATVGIRKKIGDGELVYLGAMLGPHLLASDPDALCATTHLLVGPPA